MSLETELVCKHCGNEYFYIVYDLSIGHVEGKETQFELLKCMDCGTMNTKTFETTREN